MTVRFVRGKSLKKIKGVQLDKEKLGNKWICPTTGKKFYDLNKEPIISPYTGEIIEIPNTEDSEKEKTDEIILENDNKETSQISEEKETTDIDNVESDVGILDDNSEESIPEIDESFNNESEQSEDNIDELEEFEIDEEIDDELSDDEFLDDSDDDSVEDVIGSVKANNDEG